MGTQVGKLDDYNTQCLRRHKGGQRVTSRWGISARHTRILVGRARIGPDVQRALAALLKLPFHIRSRENAAARIDERPLAQRQRTPYTFALYI
jgi:hypothetical protein